MELSIPESDRASILQYLQSANHVFKSYYPGIIEGRQPIQVLYGGANLFRRNTVEKVAELAVKQFNTYAPDFASFARSFGFAGADELPTRTVADELPTHRAINSFFARPCTMTSPVNAR